MLLKSIVINDFYFGAKVKLLPFVILAILAGCSKSTDIPVREKYWTKEITTGLPIGSNQAAMEAFFKTRGQKVECFTLEGNTRIFNDRKAPNACAVRDTQSEGGFSNIPVKLSIEFEMREGKLASYKFSTTSATGPTGF